MLVRALPPAADGRVLVAGAPDEASALYFAANGCDVTTLGAETEPLERVMQAAIGAGLAGRVHAQVGDLASWTPDESLNAVIVNPSALHGLSPAERARVIELLQTATIGRRRPPRPDDPRLEQVGRGRHHLARGAQEPLSRVDGDRRAEPGRQLPHLRGAEGRGVRR